MNTSKVKTINSYKYLTFVMSLFIAFLFIECSHNDSRYIKLRKLKKHLSTFDITSESDGNELSTIDFEEYITVAWDSIYILNMDDLDDMISKFGIMPDYGEPEEVTYIVIKSDNEFYSARIQRYWLLLTLDMSLCNKKVINRYGFSKYESTFRVHKKFIPYYGDYYYKLTPTVCMK